MWDYSLEYESRGRVEPVSEEQALLLYPKG